MLGELCARAIPWFKQILKVFICRLPQRNGLILEALRVKYANLCQVMAQIVARKPACKVSRDAGTGKRISAKV
mgnify:CR=1 FL=1